MPSLDIHLAIAKKYIEKNSITNISSFFEGSVAPDLAPNLKISHYSGLQNKNNLVQYLENKVCLKKFLDNEPINDDYHKGVFIHLITDYLFFTTFLDKNYLKNISYEEFRKDLYYSYNLINGYLNCKYKIDYEQMLSSDLVEKIKNRIKTSQIEANIRDEIRINLINNDKLDSFINYISNINLENYKKQILNDEK